MHRGMQLQWTLIGWGIWKNSTVRKFFIHHHPPKKIVAHFSVVDTGHMRSVTYANHTMDKYDSLITPIGRGTLAEMTLQSSHNS